VLLLLLVHHPRLGRLLLLVLLRLVHLQEKAQLRFCAACLCALQEQLPH
jgi:hypothetical protein